MKSVRILIATVSALAVAAPGWAQPATTLDVTGAAELEVLAPELRGPIDDRFFGTFCQTVGKRFCKDVDWAPDPCAEVDSMAIHLDHVLTATGGRRPSSMSPAGPSASDCGPPTRPARRTSPSTG